jgi:uncharacterized protein DUF5906/bifunctional DNA primase/polymerase-like protein
MDQQTQKVNSDRTIAAWKEYATSYLLSETLPIIPPDAPLSDGTTVHPEMRGKTPGVHRPDGWIDKDGKRHSPGWVGLGGKWKDERFTTLAEAKAYWKMGASIGVQTRRYIAIDIDAETEKIAVSIEELCVKMLGFAPVRLREGSTRRLLVYERAGDDLIFKHRVAFKFKGIKHAVDILGYGQQFVAEGIHPSGKPYTWRNGSDLVAWAGKLAKVTLNDVDAFFKELENLIKQKGGQIITKQASHGGAHLPLTDPRLHAPSLEAFRKALASIDIEKLENHDDAVRFVAAAKAAAYPWLVEAEGDILGKFREHPAFEDDDYFFKIYNSVTDADLGWSWLLDLAHEHGYDDDVQEDFDDDVSKRHAEDIEKNGDPNAKARKAMFDSHVWVRSVGRYYNTKDGGFLDGRAFNAENTDVVPFGRAAGQNAEAVFMNDAKAKKVVTVTLQPGEPIITTAENEYGVSVSAVNLWRPSKVKPAKDVRDEQVAPWLDLVEKHYGPEGTLDREHILNCLAFMLQRPGHKLGHAPLIIGHQKTGKDSLLRPCFEAAGRHNVATISPETLAGQFNAFLKKPIIYGEEVITFGRRDLYNKLKPWISAQATRLLVNEKHLAPYYVDNHHFWIFVSNYDNAISLDDDDRRFCVLQVRLETPPPDEYFTAYHSWLDNGGTELVAGWLMQHDLSKFNPMAAPPMTAAKQTMIEQSQPKEVRWLREQFRDDGLFANRTVLATNDLLKATDAAEWQAPPGIRDKHAIVALKAEGFTPAHRVRVGNDIRRLWVSNTSGKLEGYSPEALREQYLVEVGQGSSARGVEW